MLQSVLLYFQAYEPYSLLGLSVEAAATCYRFNPRDLFFYHREIDFSHLHAGALTTLDYGKRMVMFSYKLLLISRCVVERYSTEKAFL